MSNLILHLPLDYQDDSDQFIDASGSGQTVTVSADTAPTLIDDAEFGPVASFDGSSQLITLADAATLGLSNASFTIETWLQLSESIADVTASGVLPVIGSVGSGTGNVLHCTIKNGIPHMGFWNIDIIATGTVLATGVWYHLAWVYDSDAQTQTLYLNGNLLLEGSGKGALTSTDTVTVGNYNNTGNFFHGHLANLRVYDGALAVADIKRDMYQDYPNYAFNTTHPVAFNLYDKEVQNTLYIEDDPANQVFTLEITNASAQEITLADTGNTTVSDSNYHFALKFRAQTLSTETLSGENALQLSSDSSSNWSLTLATDSNQKDVVYLLGSAGATISPDETLSIALENVGASGTQGSRGTQVELVTDHLYYTAAPDHTLQLSRINHLSVINHRGKEEIPLHAGFVGANTVLNDGASPSTLVLRLSNHNFNTSTTVGQDLRFTYSDDETEKSKLIISFDTDTDNAYEEWALAAAGQIKEITLTAPTDWSVEKVDGTVPEWIVSPTDADQTLAAGGHLQITITGIETDYPTGPTHLYINYENIPGYWDGKLAAIVQKQPLVFYGQQVGIGINPEEAQMEAQLGVATDAVIGGSLTTGSMKATVPSSYTLNQVGNYLLYTETPKSRDYRDGNITTAGTSSTTGLCLRVDTNPTNSKEPIFQIRSSGQAVRFFAEHDGWTGSENSAWFGGNGNSNYFGSAMQIGGDYDASATSGKQLYVNGSIGFGADNDWQLDQGSWQGANIMYNGSASSANFGFHGYSGSKTVNVIVDGNVGIGVTDPGYKLEVDGTISAEGIVVSSQTSAHVNTDGAFYRYSGQAYLTVDDNLYVRDSGSGNRIRFHFNTNNSRLGIGTTNPTNAALEVGAYVPRTVNATFGYLGPNGSSKAKFNGNKNWGIYTPHSIGAYDFLAHSDARIKNIQSLSDGTEDLQTLLRIEITDYTLKDEIGQGHDTYKKVIGQQVAAVYPQAVNQQITHVIPDIYQRSEVQKGWIVLETDLQVGQRVKIITEDQEESTEEIYEVLEVETDRFRLDAKALPKEVFVYGREVDDFHTVDYEAIAMLNVSATQALYREMKSLQQTIEQLSGDLQQVMKRLEALEQGQ